MTRPELSLRNLSSRLGLEGAPTLTIMTGAYTVMLYATTVLLARLLGAHDYGIYAVVIAVTSLVGTLATPGLEPLTTRDLIIYRSTEDYGHIIGLVKFGNRLVIGVSGLLIVGVSGAALLAYSDRTSQAAMLVGSLLIPLSALGRTRAAAIAGLGSVVVARSPELLLRPIALTAFTLTILVSVGRFRAVEAVIATVLASAVSFAVGAVIFRRILRARVPSLAPRYDVARWRKSALPYFGLAVTDIAASQIGVVLLQAFHSSSDAGLYAVASRGAAIVALVFVAVGAAAGPSAARHWANADTDELGRLVRRMIAFSIAFSLPVAVAFGICAPYLMGTFGADFADASTAFRVLCIGQFFFAALGVTGTILLMTGEERTAAWIMTGGLALALLLNVVLLPILGLVGAAIATSVSMTVCQLAMLGALLRRWPRIKSAAGQSHSTT